MKSHPMKDQVYVVTGAGKGIGRAFVEAILAHPATSGSRIKLSLVSRTRSELEQLAALASQAGVETEIVDVDLAEHPIAPVQRTLARFGRLDALIHCAGVGRFGNFLELNPKDLDDTINTNVRATFLLLQEAYRVMKAAPPSRGMRGQIQVVTSVAAERPFPHSSIYCMSKYAQRGLLEVMRGYGYQDGIRILDVRAGAALTPMWGDVSPEQESKMMKAQDVAEPMVNALFADERSTIEILTIRPLQGDI